MEQIKEAVYLINDEHYLHLRENSAGVGFATYNKVTGEPLESGQMNMNFDHEELTLMMLYNTGTRLGLVQELRLMQCYLMPDETALRELSENVIDKLKLLTDEQFAEIEFPMD